MGTHVGPRWLSGLVVLIVALASVGCGDDCITSPIVDARDTHTEAAFQDLDFAGIQRVAAATRNGRIAVQAQESESARLTIKKTVRASSLEEAERISRTVEVEVEVTDGEIIITSTYPEPRFGIDVEVDYLLTCPADVELDLEVINGEISVLEMRGETRAGITNGYIGIAPAENAEGAVTAHAVNGSIAVDLPSDVGVHVDASAVIGCIITRDGGHVVSNCFPGSRAEIIGTPGDVPYLLRTVNGTIEIYRR